MAFGSKSPELNVLEIGDLMSKKGWHLNALSHPAAIHIACTVSFRLVQSFRFDRPTTDDADMFVMISA